MQDQVGVTWHSETSSGTTSEHQRHAPDWVRGHVRIGQWYPRISARSSLHQRAPVADAPLSPPAVQATSFAVAVARRLVERGLALRELEVEAAPLVKDGEIRPLLRIAAGAPGLDETALLAAARAVLRDEPSLTAGLGTEPVLVASVIEVEQSAADEPAAPARRPPTPPHTPALPRRAWRLPRSLLTSRSPARRVRRAAQESAAGGGVTPAEPADAPAPAPAEPVEVRSTSAPSAPAEETAISEPLRVADALPTSELAAAASGPAAAEWLQSTEPARSQQPEGFVSEAAQAPERPSRPARAGEQSPPEPFEAAEARRAISPEREQTASPEPLEASPSQPSPSAERARRAPAAAERPAARVRPPWRWRASWSRKDVQPPPTPPTVFRPGASSWAGTPTSARPEPEASAPGAVSRSPIEEQGEAAPAAGAIEAAPLETAAALTPAPTPAADSEEAPEPAGTLVPGRQAVQPAADDEQGAALAVAPPARAKRRVPRLMRGWSPMHTLAVAAVALAIMWAAVNWDGSLPGRQSGVGGAEQVVVTIPPVPARAGTAQVGATPTAGGPSVAAKPGTAVSALAGATISVAGTVSTPAAGTAPTSGLGTAPAGTAVAEPTTAGTSRPTTPTAQQATPQTRSTPGAAQATYTAGPALPTANSGTAQPTAPVSAQAQNPTPGASDQRIEFRAGATRGGWLNDQKSAAWFAPDGYHLFARQPGLFVAVGVPDARCAGDVQVTATFQKAGGPAGGGYGVIVRDQGSPPRDGVNQGGRYFVLEVGDLGQIGIWRREGDQWIDILPWTDSASVRPGSAPNTLVVRAVGSTLSLAVNGGPAVSGSDPTLSNGCVGLFVGGDQNEAVLTSLTVEPLSP